MRGWFSMCVALATAASGCALVFDGEVGDDDEPAPDPGVEPNPNPDPPPEDQPRLAFSSNRRGFYEVFTARADGTNVRRVATGGQPAWSRDGQRLAFASSGIVYTMDWDGSNIVPQAEGDDPAWSVDGKRLVFTNHQGIVTRAVTSAGGSAGTSLVLAHTFCQVNGEGFCATPRYSADGTTISFVLANATNPLRVYLMSSAGTNVRPLLPPSSTWTDSPTWKAAGWQLIYTTTDSSGTVFVAQAQSDGTGRVNLVSGFDISVPAIAPNGKDVAFQYAASAATPMRIWIQSDGLVRQLIPNDPSVTTTYEDVELAWAPLE